MMLFSSSSSSSCFTFSSSFAPPRNKALLRTVVLAPPVDVASVFHAQLVRVRCRRRTPPPRSLSATLHNATCVPSTSYPVTTLRTAVRYNTSIRYLVPVYRSAGRQAADATVMPFYRFMYIYTDLYYMSSRTFIKGSLQIASSRHLLFNSVKPT